MKLSKVDKTAIQSFDSEYLFKKGKNFFYDEDYEVALEYFHLSVAMGNIEAIGYIGHCYLFGKGVPEEVDLGLSYYKTAIESNDITSMYRLGKLYFNGTGIEKDQELAIYYYKKAFETLKEEEYSEWLKHPELFYLIAIESLPGGKLSENIPRSYDFLHIAKEGYEKYIADGAFYFENDLTKVLEQMNNEVYKDIRFEMGEENE